MPLRSRKQLALLVYLALEAQGHPVSREHLIELLWSDVPSERGRHSLSQALSALRERLGSDALPPGRGPVRLSEPLSTDLDRLNNDGELPDAFSQPLAGLEEAGGSEFAHWLDATRARCHSAAMGVLTKQLEAARAAGDHETLHDRATQLYSVDPYSDAAVQVLAERLVVEGDRAEAVRLLRTHVERAHDEIGCEPNAGISRLLKRLEAGATEPLQPPPDAHLQRAEASPEVFIGREAELGQLEALWTKARAGERQTCLVTGPAGIGKTSLIRRFGASVATRGGAVWQVSCRDLGHDVPFAAVSELIYALMREPAVSGAEPRWLAEASRVTPGLRSVYPGVPEPPPAPAETVRLRVAEALAQMLDAAADGTPTLLVLDDVPEMDPASRHVLSVLVRRMAADPVLVLAGRRTAEEPQGTSEDEDAEALSWAEALDVPPVSSEQAWAIIDALLAEMPTAESVPRSTITDLGLGNPYFIEMLVSDWRRHQADSLAAAEARGEPAAAKWRPPESMRGAFGRQYRGLAEPAERMLYLLAVAGREMPLTELASLLGVPAHDADHAVIEVLERGMVRTQGERLSYKNELHRAYVYYAMGEETRRYLHARLARALSERAAEDDFQRELEASHHFLRADMTEEAAQAASHGAEPAIARGAPGEAERAINAVLAAVPGAAPPRLLLLLAEALSAQGKHQAALDVLERWNPADADHTERAAGAALKAEALFWARLADDATTMRAAQEALRTAEQAGDDDLVIRALRLNGAVAAQAQNREVIRAVKARAAFMESGAAEARVRAVASLVQGQCLTWLGEDEVAEVHVRNAITRCKRLSLDTYLLRAQYVLGRIRSRAGDTARALAAFQDAREGATRVGDLIAKVACLFTEAEEHMALGDYARAEECLECGQQDLNVAPDPRRTCELYLSMTALKLMRREFAAAGRSLESLKEHSRAVDIQWVTHAVLLLDADYQIALGRAECAWPLVEQANELAVRKVPNTGSYDHERLWRHYLWATQGIDAMLEQSRHHPTDRLGLRLKERIELRAFEEWVLWQERGERPSGTSGFDELRAHGYKGSIDYLAALGITDEWRSEGQPDATS